jgi:hypothetical protein
MRQQSGHPARRWSTSALRICSAEWRLTRADCAKYQLQKFQTDFAKEIAKAYGLERGITNSGTKKQSFHTYNRIVHAAIPELHSMDIPKAAFGILTDPKSFGESVLAQYQELMKPE